MFLTVALQPVKCTCRSKSCCGQQRPCRNPRHEEKRKKKEVDSVLADIKSPVFIVWSPSCSEMCGDQSCQQQISAILSLFVVQKWHFSNKVRPNLTAGCCFAPQIAPPPQLLNLQALNFSTCSDVHGTPRQFWPFHDPQRNWKCF